MRNEKLEDDSYEYFNDVLNLLRAKIGEHNRLVRVAIKEGRHGELWTQSKLSEKTGLGIPTIAGYGLFKKKKYKDEIVPEKKHNIFRVDSMFKLMRALDIEVFELPLVHKDKTHNKENSLSIDKVFYPIENTIIKLKKYIKETNNSQNLPQNEVDYSVKTIDRHYQHHLNLAKQITRSKERNDLIELFNTVSNDTGESIYGLIETVSPLIKKYAKEQYSIQTISRNSDMPKGTLHLEYDMPILNNTVINGNNSSNFDSYLEINVPFKLQYFSIFIQSELMGLKEGVNYGFIRDLPFMVHGSVENTKFLDVIEILNEEYKLFTTPPVLDANYMVTDQGGSKEFKEVEFAEGYSKLAVTRFKTKKVSYRECMDVTNRFARLFIDLVTKLLDEVYNTLEIDLANTEVKDLYNKEWSIYMPCSTIETKLRTCVCEHALLFGYSSPDFDIEPERNYYFSNKEINEEWHEFYEANGGIKGNELDKAISISEKTMVVLYRRYISFQIDRFLFYDLNVADSNKVAISNESRMLLISFGNMYIQRFSTNCRLELCSKFISDNFSEMDPVYRLFNLKEL